MIQRMFVTLDTKKTNYKNVGKINHGDDLILELTVLSDGDMISFNDPMVDLLVKKSDGKMIRQNSGIEHIKPNKFVIEVSKDCVTSPGLSTNQLIINDNGRISTCMFYYTILNSLEEDIIESISSVEVLEQLDEYVIEARERMELLNNDINELEKLFGATSDKLVEAENARNEAEQNRISSEILRVNNENDRIEADNIRNQNEIDRSSSELVREQRESERMLNEEERRQNESERMIDESTRQQNENARQSNESIRMNNETDRKIQENIRVTAETNRVNAETIRRNNENSRISNETKRQKTMNEMNSLIDEAKQNENARQSNESIRMSNETDRKNQENRRVTAETNRVNAETNRVNAETTRRNNENSRIFNETERQKTIEEMKRLIDEANGFDDVYDSKIDFFGKEHDKLSTRLNADFDNVHQRINESELLPYEGVNIKADNSYYGLQKDTVIKGRTLQNLCDSDLFFNKNKWSNLTDNYHELSNGYLTLRARGGYVNGFSINNGMFKPSTTYTIVFDIKENTLVSTGSSTFAFNSDPSIFNELIQDGDYLTKGKHLIKVTTKDNITEIKNLLRSFIFTSVTSGSITFRYAIFEGDHTQTPLEELPFIEGIESVGDKSKNLCNNNDFEQGTVDIETGVNTNSDFRVRSGFIKVEPNTTYMLTTPNDLSFRSFISYDANKNFVRQLIGIPLTTNSNERFLKIILSKNGDNEVIKAADVHDVQLEKGETESSYKPYYDGYKISGKSCGKNLAKEISKENYVAKGYGEVIFENNKCIAIDKTGWAGCFIAGKDAIKVKPNTAYYTGLECEEDSAQTSLAIKCLDRNNNVITRDGTVSLTNNLVDFHNSTYNNVYGAFLPLNSHFKFVRFSSEVHSVKLIFRPASSSGTITNTFKNIIFAETNKQPTYEPYQESNYSYILNEPLRSLPNGVCDEIDLKTGVLTRRVGVLRITGEEKWGELVTSHEMYNESSCNMNIEKVFVEETNSISSFTSQTAYNRVASPYDNTAVWIRVPKTIDTIEKFKTHVKNGEAYGELLEPIIEQLTPQQIKSFDTTTHIISDNKLMPIVSTKIPSNVQAIISTLRLENSELRNNLETLSGENEELKETNIVQDEMIDISMMATDEMYSMLEPLLENIPMPMKFEEGASKLVYLYVAMVQRGLKTLDEVPTRYREQVRAMIQYN